MLFDVNKFQFGVEIEFTGQLPQRAIAAVAKAVNGNKKYSVLKDDQQYIVVDANGRIWKIVHDTSIYAQRVINGKPTIAASIANEYKYQLELVTPILRYDSDIPTLMIIVNELKAINAVCNHSTGLHVHVFAGMFNTSHLLNAVNIFYSKQNLLMEALSVYPQRAGYCQPLSEKLVTRLNDKKPKTFRQFAEEYYKDYGGYNVNIFCHQSPARYFALNLHSFFENHTLEFRLFNSTLNAYEIQADVLLALGICNQALYQTNTSYEIIADDDISSFKCWLRQIGLTGEKYSSAQKILLQNLESSLSKPNNGTPTIDIQKEDDIDV